MQETRTYEALSYVDEATKRSVGYEAENFIIDCQFAGYPCYTWSVVPPRRHLRAVVSPSISNHNHFLILRSCKQ